METISPALTRKLVPVRMRVELICVQLAVAGPVRQKNEDYIGFWQPYPGATPRDL
jgi:hypothetical protein